MRLADSTPFSVRGLVYRVNMRDKGANPGAEYKTRCRSADRMLSMRTRSMPIIVPAVFGMAVFIRVARVMLPFRSHNRSNSFYRLNRPNNRVFYTRRGWLTGT